MWRCARCQMTFPLLRKYRHHMKRHEDEHYCERCSAKLPTAEALNIHNALHFRDVATQTYESHVFYHQPSRKRDRYDGRGHRPEDSSRSPLRTSTSSSSSFRCPPPSSSATSSSRRSPPPSTSHSSRSSAFSRLSRPSTSTTASTSSSTSSSTSRFSFKPPSFLSTTSGSSAVTAMPGSEEDEFDRACKEAEEDDTVIL